MRSIRRSVSWLGLGAIAFLLVLGASLPPLKPAGEPDAPARVSAARVQSAVPAASSATTCPAHAASPASLARRLPAANAGAARAASRPTRLDPLMTL